jgi:dTDP-4-amino-4,6-dideoxygalactose transaminase
VKLETQSPAPGKNRAGTARFPFLDLQGQFSAIREEVVEAVQRVLESQHFILGAEVSALEEELATLLDCKFAIGCASCSDALLLALMALDAGEGDEVVTAPFTFVATAGAIARLGARPVFVDIDADTFNLDPAYLEGAITPRTKAILPVHLFGLSADMDPILRVADQAGIPVIEDAAQAILARYRDHKVGSVGKFGCFSFFPSKNLGGAGDGGLITTDDADLADKLKLLRAHGSRTKYQYDLIGTNSRLDAMQAAILRVKLRHLDSWTEQRRRNARRYDQLFQEYGLAAEVQTPISPPECYHVYNQYTIRVTLRDQLKQHLALQGIPSEIYYPTPLHLQKAFQYLGYSSGDFPNSERAGDQVLSLPVCPELTEERQQMVVEEIRGFFRREARLAR